MIPRIVAAVVLVTTASCGAAPPPPTGHPSAAARALDTTVDHAAEPLDASPMRNGALRRCALPTLVRKVDGRGPAEREGNPAVDYGLHNPGLCSYEAETRDGAVITRLVREDGAAVRRHASCGMGWGHVVVAPGARVAVRHYTPGAAGVYRVIVDLVRVDTRERVSIETRFELPAR